MQDWGQQIVETILRFAGLLTEDWVPGLVSGCMAFVAIALLFLMLWQFARQRHAVNYVANQVAATRGLDGFARSFAEISAKLERTRNTSKGPLKNIATAWGEYRETVIEPSNEDGYIQNAIRPGAFFNTSNLGFGFRGWRFWPGLFVSVGLLLTFLGLVAALQQTSVTLGEASRGAGELAMAEALNELLTVASAKFIMSLTGLVLSIVLIVAIRSLDAGIDKVVTRLAQVLEDRLLFVSLESLSQRQLKESQETRAHMQRLNAELIEALTRPLADAAQAGGNEAATVMKSVGKEMAETLSVSVSEASEKMANAATSMSQTTQGLDSVSRRIEMVLGELTTASEALATAALPIAENLVKSEEMTRTIANTGIEVMEGANTALKSQAEAISAAAEAIREQVEAFEQRAQTYDGDMARALDRYRQNLDAAVSQVSKFSGEVHSDYADALNTLRSVIDGARSFKPEPGPPDGQGQTL